LIKTFVIP